MPGAIAALAALWLALACGGPAQGAAKSPKVLHASYASFPDYLDPQLAYTYEGWNAMYDTYIPLLTYRHAGGKAGSEVIPGLARRLPRISDGGKRYELQLRRGLHYSSGQPVRASDFGYTVRRMLRMGSGGSPFFHDIVGFRQFQQRKSAGIAGIAADNRSGRIVITLVRANGTFTQSLALPFVALVPRGTPFHDLSGKPPPATGPYSIAKSRIGEGWTYVRNPAWTEKGGNGPLLPQLPDGHVDRAEVQVTPDPRKQVAALEHGEVDWIQNPPPPQLAARIKRRYLGTQFRIEPTLSLYYFWMNTTKAPFDDVRVRQAVNYAVDPVALKRIYGGQLTPTQQILPPGMPGYRRFKLYPHNMGKARRLIAKANPGDRRITVWADTESPNNEATAYYAGVLRRLGFKVRLKTVGADFYFFSIGKPSTPNLDTGWADWFGDYPHPNDFFQPLLSGESIRPREVSNFSRIDVPDLNHRILQLRQHARIPRAGYAYLDRDYMKLAPIAPYGVRALSTFVSKSIDLDKVVYNPSFGADLASFRFK